MRAFLSEQKTQAAICLAVILAAQGIAVAAGGSGFISKVVYVGYLVFTLAFAMVLVVPRDGKTILGAANAKTVVPRAIVSTETLRAKRSAMDAGLAKLTTLTVFSANDPTLDEAWEKKNIERIEAILKKGDELTRSNWQQGIAVFNSAAADVDIRAASFAIS